MTLTFRFMRKFTHLHTKFVSYEQYYDSQGSLMFPWSSGFFLNNLPPSSYPVIFLRNVKTLSFYWIICSLCGKMEEKIIRGDDKEIILQRSQELWCFEMANCWLMPHVWCSSLLGFMWHSAHLWRPVLNALLLWGKVVKICRRRGNTWQDWCGSAGAFVCWPITAFTSWVRALKVNFY